MCLTRCRGEISIEDNGSNTNYFLCINKWYRILSPAFDWMDSYSYTMRINIDGGIAGGWNHAGGVLYSILS